MTRMFQIALIKHSEGVSVSCPELPGCHSQGETVDEAVENIRDAIEGYLEVYGEPEIVFETREIEVAIQPHAEAARS
jgi:predicted RNase H-like HicB family nuclease